MESRTVKKTTLLVAVVLVGLLSVMLYSGLTGGTNSTATVLILKPKVTFTSNPNSITSGQSSTLSWTSSYASSCTLSPYAGTIGTAGSVVVRPTVTTTYYLTCRNSLSKTKTNVTVTVMASTATTTATLTANPIYVTVGQPAVLAWTSTNASSCILSPHSDSISTNGTVTVRPNTTTTYKIACTGNGGTVAQSVTVGVAKNATFPIGDTKILNNRVEVGSTPYFPIGMFYTSWDKTVGELQETIGATADNGFNTIHLSCTNVETCRGALDAAQLKGVKVVIQGAGVRDPDIIVPALKGYPALLGYSIGDDVHIHDVPEDLVARDSAIKVNDPNIITYWSDFGTPEGIRAFAGTGDVLGPYTYPIVSVGPLGEIDYLLTQLRDTFNPFWGVIQSFNWNDYEKTGQRYPYPDEYRNMMYQAVVNGAKGLLNFDISARNNQELWNEMKVSAEELTVLAPVLLNGTFTKLPFKDGVIGAYWQYQGSTYVVVVNLAPLNTSRPTRSVSYAIPGSGSLYPIFTNRPSGLLYSNGTLSGTIGWKEVHVYVIN